MEEILRVLLECGSCDLRILDNVNYDLGKITRELVAEGIKPTLNDITRRVFMQGQYEIAVAVINAITERKDKQTDVDDTVEGRAEYARLQWEIDELEALNTKRDMDWYCDGIATACWFRDNEEIYRRYLPDEIKDIESNMGFEF